jgi:AraC family transcriptional regulator, activator of mtrCDE
VASSPPAIAVNPGQPEEDLLSSVLSAYQLRASVDAHQRFCGRWQVGDYGHPRAAFHLVGEGRCWLHTRQSAAPEPLEDGDLVVLPHGAWHVISGSPAWPAAEGTGGEDGPYTTLVCGYFEFQGGQHNPILDALPEVLILRRRSAGRHFVVLGELLLAEARSDSLGTQTVLDKLADSLFVMIVRHHVNHSHDQRGLLAALADPRLRKALSAMHREPARAWTLETLAHTAAMSRAAFAQRFSELMEAAPIEYLTRWRMTQAELMLRNPQVSVARVAGQVGYQTEAAFRKAFKRIHGIGPGALRRRARPQPPAADAGA